jgi:hypothetical protein
MFGIFQSTPPYAGDGQPSPGGRNGAFGWLTGLFAFPGTPSYLPATQKAPAPGAPSDQAPSAEAMCTSPTSSVPVAIVIQRAE